MPKTKHENVESLSLDLKNFRTVHQVDEEHAVNALIGIEPDWFWALMESLLDDGYSATENIIVLKSEKAFPNAADSVEQLVVKEGNRRLAALKLIFGWQTNIELPEYIQEKIQSLTPQWKKDNSKVPCVVYEGSESGLVDKLVSRTHAKGEKAGRAVWTAIARARYGRDLNNISEPGLDLLEKYLASGKNLSGQQAERWAGNYPLTVLNEAIQKMAPLLDCKTAADLVGQYPAKNKKLVEAVLNDIGTSQLGFKELRSIVFWGLAYGLKPKPTESQSGGQAKKPATSGQAGKKGKVAYELKDPRSVRRKLREFKVLGPGRDKIATLAIEIKGLRHEAHPHAFCFLLRSLFELSAKAYCADHKKDGLSLKKPDGSDKTLAAVLRDITKHLTSNGADKEKLKLLHGPMTELAKADGILSVTSMNQLVHNPSFSVSPPDISIVFWNIFPLLQEMNT